MPYDNTNTGILTKNDRKETDNHPDMRGSINVDGQEYWVSAWTKVGRDGTKLEGQRYLSLSLQPKEPRDRPVNRQREPRQAQQRQSRQQPRGQHPQDLDDDIPF